MTLSIWVLWVIATFTDGHIFTKAVGAFDLREDCVKEIAATRERVSPPPPDVKEWSVECREMTNSQKEI